MGTSHWHCRGLEEAKSGAFTFVDHVLVFSELREVQVESITPETLYVKLNISASLAWAIGKESSACQTVRCFAGPKSVFYRGEKSVALFKSTLGSADEKPGPHSLVTAVLLKWVVMRTVRFNRNVIYSCVLSPVSPSLLFARGSLSFCKEVSGKAASLAD